MSPLTPVLLASSSMEIRSGADVNTGSIVSTGAGELAISNDALLNDVWSTGLVSLRARSNIRGSLHATNVQREDGAIVSSWDTSPIFEPKSTLTWQAIFPTVPSTEDVTLEPGVTFSLPPGNYRSILVNAGATLTLSAGTYFLSKWDLESSGVLQLDQANGPIVVYVSDGLIHRGATTAGAATPDLLLVYLGFGDIFIESAFRGALVAPAATVNIRAVAEAHEGYFAGKTIALDANAKIRYVAPGAIVSAAGPRGRACRHLLESMTDPGSYIWWASRYCRACYSGADTDQDDTPDCIDECPYDPNKVAPGVCGCGTAETDSDVDGTPDCVDGCPKDPEKTSPGQCGCSGVPGSRALGAKCTDTAGPMASATCDGNGQCGTSAPFVPGNGCRLITWRGTAYWFCGISSPTGRKDQAGSQAACSDKGLTLLRIDSPSENSFLTRILPPGQAVWLGANSMSTSGKWRWSGPTTADGDLFWEGGVDGYAVESRYANWGPAEPATGQCAVVDSTDGAWSSVDCTRVLGYICVYRTPLVGGADGGADEEMPGTKQPPPAPGPCVPEAESGLPGTPEELNEQIALADAGIFVGAAKNPPPPGSRCFNAPASNAIGLDPKAGCFFVPNGGSGCTKDSECGDGYLCRYVKLDPNCHPPADAGRPVKGETCPTVTMCGTIECPDDDLPCDEREVCNPGTDFDAGIDPASVPKLAPSPLEPSSLFKNGVPDAGATAAYLDEPTVTTGKDHTWCKMGTQNPSSVAPAHSPADDKGGQTRNGASIVLGFDPDLQFDVQANPLALGENKMNLHARAALVASVDLKFLGKDFHVDVVKAAADIVAERCGVTTDATTFEIFGLDFIAPEDIPSINTNDPGSTEFSRNLYNLSRGCRAALDQYQVWANRAKKAYRDAQQLLFQYHDLKKAGQVLAGNLCEALGVADANVPGFPGSAQCYPGETPETTINRFIYYYQAPGVGQIDRLRDVASSLSTVSALLSEGLRKDVRWTFLDNSHQESHNILTAQFAIGPVPMVLEIDLATKYGIGGEFVVDLRLPLNLDSDTTGPVDVATVSVNVLPHASAALSAFVGAGIGNRVISAKVGIEGAVSLGRIQVPAFAGAGLAVASEEDIRPVPTDVDYPISIAPKAFQFGIPKAFKFYAKYEYGAAVDLDNVLDGTISGKVRIKFWCFSRTWRKQIARFNGRSWHFNLLKGGGSKEISVRERSVPNTAALPSEASTTAVAEGKTQLGRSEAEVPLTVLAYLEPESPTIFADAGAAPEDGGVLQPGTPVNLSKLTKVFYDDLCCSKRGEACSQTGTPQCCPDSVCIATGSDGLGTCGAECGQAGASCEGADDCCEGLVCGSLKTCGTCSPYKAPCQGNADCCSGRCNAHTLLCMGV